MSGRDLAAAALIALAAGAAQAGDTAALKAQVEAIAMRIGGTSDTIR